MTNATEDSEILFRGRYVTVVARDRPPDPVFVTFNPLIGTAPGDRFWSESFLRQQRVAAIGIVSSGPDWFPADEMKSAVEAVRRRTEGRRVLTYGYSRGGYGALKFSRALGAERSIALCPRLSVPADGGRPGRVDRVHLEPTELCGCNHVFFDPACAEDADVVRRVDAAAAAAAVLLEKIRAPFSSHETLQTFIEGGHATELIGRFTAESPPDSRALRTLVRSARQRSSTYHLHRVKWLLGRRHRGLRLLSSSLPSIPSGPVRAFAEMSLLIAEGRIGDATTVLQNISDEALMKRFLPLWCWQYFRDCGFHAGERRLAPLLTAEMPGHPFARLLAVNSYITLGERELASREFDEALALEGVERLRNEVAVIAWLLGRPDPFAGRERT